MDTGEIDLVEDIHIAKAYSNIKGRHSMQKKALVGTLYSTGARPAEVLELKAKNVIKIPRYLEIHLIGVKKGVSRTLKLPYRSPAVKSIWEYAQSVPPEAYLFWKFRAKTIHKRYTKKGELRENREISNRLRYYFKKWFTDVFDDPITPYYLRHSRMSKLMENGATIEQLKFWKGAKDIASVNPYTHMSKKMRDQLSRLY
jgi:site-specific recombinase XerD